MTRVSYSIITPARNEGANLRRLARCLETQTHVALAWTIVDTGSDDDTVSLAEELAAEHDWIQVAQLSPIQETANRAIPIVRAFHCGIAELREHTSLVVKLDADITVGSDHFARLADEFEMDPTLGIASGKCYERQADGHWHARNSTGPGVWGACRAYRWDCLLAVSPLEERMGWDTLDLVKAHVNGWRTAVFHDLPFLHHGVEGIREGSRLRRWARQGEAARYMGYRFSYLLIRTGYHALRDPAAVALLAGYAGSALRREPVCADKMVRKFLRDQQAFRRLPERLREASRPRQTLDRSLLPDP